MGASYLSEKIKQAAERQDSFTFTLFTAPFFPLWVTFVTGSVDLKWRADKITVVQATQQPSP